MFCKNSFSYLLDVWLAMTIVLNFYDVFYTDGFILWVFLFFYYTSYFNLASFYSCIIGCVQFWRYDRIKKVSLSFCPPVTVSHWIFCDQPAQFSFSFILLLSFQTLFILLEPHIICKLYHTLNSKYVHLSR